MYILHLALITGSILLNQFYCPHPIADNDYPISTHFVSALYKQKEMIKI